MYEPVPNDVSFSNFNVDHTPGFGSFDADDGGVLLTCSDGHDAAFGHPHVVPDLDLCDAGVMVGREDYLR